MTLVLVEGPDRAGKTTEVKRIARLPRKRKLVIMHFEAPPKGQSARVLEEMTWAYHLAEKYPNTDFLLDRGHVSWFAYEHLLRGSAYLPELVKTFEQLHTGLDAVIVRCAAAPTDLLKRDDGMSTYTKKTKAATLQAIRRECQVFTELIDSSSWVKLPPGTWQP